MSRSRIRAEFLVRASTYQSGPLQSCLKVSGGSLFGTEGSAPEWLDNSSEPW